MPKFKIYYGLGGSFGGAKYGLTEEFDNQDAAIDFAYEQAVEEYQRYSYSGLLTYEKVKEDMLKVYPDASDEDFEVAYLEEMERWLSYKVEVVEE